MNIESVSGASTRRSTRCTSASQWGTLDTSAAWRSWRPCRPFWPNRQGKFPFDVGCDLAVYQLQPRLDIGLSPREVRRWERQWE
jgi:hypothetical protein